jgi:hypothetical protein
MKRSTLGMRIQNFLTSKADKSFDLDTLMSFLFGHDYVSNTPAASYRKHSHPVRMRLDQIARRMEHEGLGFFRRTYEGRCVVLWTWETKNGDASFHTERLENLAKRSSRASGHLHSTVAGFKSCKERKMLPDSIVRIQGEKVIKQLEETCVEVKNVSK